LQAENFHCQVSFGDRIYTNHEDKAQMVDQFYENLLGNSIDRENTINMNELGVCSYNLSDLDLPFTEEEVWSTIKKLSSDKAPSPDGLTCRFYKSCWSVIKQDIMRAISAIWSRKNDGFSALNITYIMFIPKIDGAEQPTDFRPISLVHSFTKLLIKIMANRLADRLHQMVSPNQSAFIKGRFIQDNFMLIQQTARSLQQQNGLTYC
jgi:hypothetical protein